ncbi:hypothetical protein LIER_00372 [Lithospermum erythrorhizon]|uniref:CCHC-type domain-containing protein n=1 Tax=Lithospermum erythrorhizon TaxID=34254 RepID=A0AAV3NI93_LITER
MQDVFRMGRMQDVFRMSSQSNSGFQGCPFKRSRFGRSQFSAPATNSRFSTAGSVPRLFSKFGRSQGSYQGRQGDKGCFHCSKPSHKAMECREKAVF